uniref:Uncharacterized protein n=1 Tax=Anopheles culicifacies TaxID=139723 RepID=A0A182MWT1_9DIPT
MDQQQYCLKWSNYSSNLAAAFSNLFDSATLTDVTLVCGALSFRFPVDDFLQRLECVEDEKDVDQCCLKDGPSIGSPFVVFRGLASSLGALDKKRKQHQFGQVRTSTQFYIGGSMYAALHSSIGVAGLF